MDKVRKRIVFHGRVQEVGFRYRAKYLSKSFMLSGWVENKWDGTVLMEVQGQELLIDRFLERLCAGSHINVEKIDIEEIPPEKGSGFYVR